MMVVRYTLGVQLLLFLYIWYGVCVNIKLVDPPHTNRYYSSSSYNNPKVLTLRAPPANVSGPPHLQLLRGECFKLKDKSYTYSFCPFHNITQKEDSSVWNNFYGVLGIWREWIIQDDVFTGMHYTLGEPCGTSNNREVKILFNCSTVTVLNNVSEPSTCKYTMWFHTPLACFKGAMQIYHVLSKSQIAAWDQAISDHNNGELTDKGLSKRRSAVLLEAGLYYNFTKDDEYLEKTKEQSTKSDTTISTSFTSVKQTQSDLDQCKTRVKSFEEQLLNATQQMRTVLSMIGSKDAKLREEIELYLSSSVTNHTTPSNATLTNGPSNYTKNSSNMPSVKLD